MSFFIAQLLEESLESPSDLSGIHERVLDVAIQMETGEVEELVTVLKKAQEDLNEQMDFSYFKRVKELEVENKKLKNDLRLCAKGLIPHGMVGGIVETEREKRHKAEEENKSLKKECEDLEFQLGGMTCDRDAKEEEIDKLMDTELELKEQLAIKEAEQEEEANLICSLKEEIKKLKEKS